MLCLLYYKASKGKGEVICKRTNGQEAYKYWMHHDVVSPPKRQSVIYKRGDRFQPNVHWGYKKLHRLSNTFRLWKREQFGLFVKCTLKQEHLGIWNPLQPLLVCMMAIYAEMYLRKHPDRCVGPSSGKISSAKQDLAKSVFRRAS